eukprot:6199836-Pleurochrysis_carterae.AAC.2
METSMHSRAPNCRTRYSSTLCAACDRKCGPSSPNRPSIVSSSFAFASTVCARAVRKVLKLAKWAKNLKDR